MTLHTYDYPQRSPEWFAARCGIVTASIVDKLLTIAAPSATDYDCPTCEVPAGDPCISLTRKTPTAIKTVHDMRVSAANIAASTAPPVITPADNDTSRAVTATLVAERITGFVEDGPMTSDMWRGVIAEPTARDLYDKHYAPTTEVGFMVEDRWGFPIGYSPDGLIGDDGLLEIKAPKAKTHLLTVLTDKVPAYNMAQLQTGLLVTGRKWIDFVPYVAGMPLWRKRVHPDPAWHEAIAAAAAKFETTAAEMVAAYEQATNNLPATERIDFTLEVI